MFHKYSVAVVLETLSLFSVVSSGALLQRLKLTAIKVVEKSSLTFSAVPVWRFSYREWCDQDQALSFKSAKKDAAKEWKSKCVCVSERDRMWVGNKKKKTVRERAEDWKVHLMERGFTKDLTLVSLNYMTLWKGCILFIWGSFFSPINNFFFAKEKDILATC